ncbi:MAG: hypothetical protein M1503_09735 [Thaumarchaeota archaeon]|nr:hypothetical protein [Nitrososphaerota archaeon]
MRKTFDEIRIPEAVYKEILKGREIGSPDVPVIERAIIEGWIKVLKVEKSKLSLPDNLGEGEKEAIILMQQETSKAANEKQRLEWLLMDDKVASTTAKLMNLTVRPAIYLLIYWTKKNVTKPSQALKMLDDIVNAGYRLSPEDYITIKQLIATYLP